MTNPTKRAGLLLTVAAAGLTATACGASAPPVGPVELSSSSGSAAAPVSGTAQSDLSAAQQPGGRQAGVDGEYKVDAGEAGTVRFAVAGRQVSLLDVALEPGWQQVRDEQRPGEIALAFSRDQTVVGVEAEVDDGRFETDVDIETSLVPGAKSYPVGDAGTVTIDPSDRSVTLVGQEAAPGWVVTVDEQELAEGDVEIQFRNDEARRSLSFEADVDNGRLNLDIDTRTGVNHFVRTPR